jgi:hypothetical protein
LFLRQGRYRQANQPNKQTDRQSGSRQLGKKEGKAHTVPARRPLKKPGSPACRYAVRQEGRQTYSRQSGRTRRKTDRSGRYAKSAFRTRWLLGRKAGHIREKNRPLLKGRQDAGKHIYAGYTGRHEAK